MKIADIQERYGLKSRQSVYDRVNALKEKGISLSSEALDKLDNHLKSGGTLSDFTEVANGYAVAQSALAPLPKEPSPIPQNQQETTLTIGELTKLLSMLTKLTNPREPLLQLKELERAAAAGWLLTSDQVRQLVGVKPATRKGDRVFTRGSFSFVKFGKIGNQAAWRVVKVLGDNLLSGD